MMLSSKQNMETCVIDRSKKTVPSFQQKYLMPRYSHTVFIEAFLIRHQVSLVTTTSLIKPKHPVLHKLFFN